MGRGKEMKPDWLKIKLDARGSFANTSSVIGDLGLTTVCDGAHCPNKCICWGSGTATFMILGQVCTRNCRFCQVKKGRTETVDESEPLRLAQAVRRLGIKHAVITSVDRDDLEDGGAAHFAKCVSEVRKTGAKVEVLIPDYEGKALEKIAASGPDVVGHNIETIRGLSPKVRDARAGYDKSLRVLRKVKEMNSEIKTKSSLMLGLGESEEEVIEAMHDLREAGVDMLTIGQYLRPSEKQVEVARYVNPDEFEQMGMIAEEMGFVSSSGPFVRSSFAASHMLARLGD